MTGTTTKPRISDRGRIVAWMLTTLTLALATVVVIVRGMLLAQVSDQANYDVQQELREFTSFVQEGVDPTTGSRFSSTERLFEVYLSSQQAGADEVLIGWTDNPSKALEVRGDRAPTLEQYDPVSDRALMAEVGQHSSGVHASPVGELRWGRSVVKSADGRPSTLLVAVFTQDRTDQVGSTVQVLALGAAASLALACLLSWMVAGQILRPVRLVQKAAAEITERDLTRRIPVGGRDDISGLAATFNAMLDRLEDAFAAEQQFVDDAGHELRTPITVIRGHLELMGDDPAERESTVALVTQELDRMARIVTDLLALAKADRPDFVQPEMADLTQLTLDLDAKVGALADRRWRLTHVAEGEAAVDTQRITQAVLQLAHNAVQHTQPGDVISLMSRVVEDADRARMLQIAVTDTGPGVAPADQERIFERFAHGEPVDGSRHSGAGLGLAIVKAIAEGHGGRVQVDSPPGQGATFTLVLPVEAGEGALATSSESGSLEGAIA